MYIGLALSVSPSYIRTYVALAHFVILYTEVQTLQMHICSALLKFISHLEQHIHAVIYV